MDPSKYEDWKLRIRNKLILNGDHYPTEAFKIEYTVSRLGGKAVEYTLLRRRSSTNSYHSADELLDQLGDIYETPPKNIFTTNYDALNNLRQQESQPFPDFYSEFMRIAGNIDANFDLDLVWKLQNKVTRRLQKRLFNFLFDNPNPSLSQLKERLMTLDLSDRDWAAREERHKAMEFASQYDKAVAEMQARKPGKYSVIARPDPEEFRR